MSGLCVLVRCVWVWCGMVYCDVVCMGIVGERPVRRGEVCMGMVWYGTL